MYDDIMQLVLQLQKKGVGVSVGCSHMGWMVLSASGDEIIRYHSAREAHSFLTGLLFGTTTVAQQING